ncbi:MAG TPA: DUF5658 family protein [Bryobacteraceae bacterium]|nr:DUF5658 family protein [Bryobacteraceae bacterium]
MLKMFFIFVFLQLGDFGTTAAVLRLGGTEENPLVRYFMNVGSIEGLAVAKTLSIAIGVACLMASKYRALRMANFVFAGIVGWNLTILLLLMA